jgi:hypothetical protein
MKSPGFGPCENNFGGLRGKKSLFCIDRGGFGSVRAWHNRNCFSQMALAFLHFPAPGSPVH